MGAVDFKFFATSFDDLVGDIWSGLNQVDIAFIFEPLLDDLHVQEAQEPAAESESEGFAGLRGKLERRIIDREFFESFAKLGELLTIAGVQAAINHSFWRLISF